MNAAEHVLMAGLRTSGPDEPALVSDGERLSYGELVARVGRFAAALHDAGIGTGDRVAMLMLDSPDLAALHLAVMAAGGVAVALSVRATADELRQILGITQPFAVVADGEFADLAAKVMRTAAPQSRLWLRARELLGWKARPETALEVHARKPTDPAFWVMTSGTTGQPKAVEHRHDNVLTCTDFFDHAFAATATDRFFATSRLHFSYALGTLFGALRKGAAIVLLERWPTPTSIAATVERHRPTILLSVPTLYHKLREARLCQAPVFRAVRCYVSAGERLAPKIGAAWEEMTGRPILDAMGCSESVYKIFANTCLSRRPGSSGRPVPGVEVRLIDNDGGPITEHGQTGRLEVRMPSLCAGYRTADTGPGPVQRPKERFKAGWFATGDQYRRDEDGFFHHCGRSDDMLKIAGMWVSPSEIEDALADVASIAEAVVVSAESAKGLAEIVLYVVPAPDSDGETAIAEARDQLMRALPPFKVPRRFAVLVDLPRTATGKIRRHKLREGNSLGPEPYLSADIP